MAAITYSSIFTFFSWIFISWRISNVQSQGIQNILHYELLEEQDPGGFTKNILTDSGLNSHYPAEILRLLTFSFLSKDAANQKYFQIEENTGMLRNVLKVNREEICPHSTTCDISLDIKTQPHPNVNLLKVTVTITDINDNVPSFEDRTVSISVSESTMAGATFALPSARDNDVGMHGIQGFRLEPQVENFNLEGTTNQDGSLDLHLILSSQLDREVHSMYNLKVLTWDGGIPQQTGSLSIDITVVDSNDNNPKFTNSTYNVQTMENIPIGTTVFQVKATDRDEGLNAALSYYFAKSTTNSYGTLFGIDRNTGGIYTKGELDREKSDLYELSVMARDGGQNKLSAYAKVKILVRDENDNAPVIKVNPLSGAHANIPEDAAIGTIVALVVVTDTDNGQNGQFMCTMDSQNFKIEYLYGNEYKIVTNSIFDREKKAEHHAKIVCDDFGNPTQSTTKDIPIYVTDINDHEPIFEENSYHATIMENNALLSSIIQVKADDADIGANADVTYTIQLIPGNASLTTEKVVTIDSKSGIVRALIPFDHESNSQYKFNVTASDNGNVKLSTSSVLYLEVLDQNDEPPKFNTSTGKYHFGTFENQVVGTEIGTVVAFDRDSFPFANISFMLDSFRSDPSTFEIDSKSGKISTRKVLDREIKSEHSMIVVAYNPGTTLQSKVNVTVFVADKNDNAPFIDFPYPGNKTVNLMGNAVEGDIVTTVLAHDLDLGNNGQLEFEIVYRNDNDIFKMDPVLGEVTLKQDVDSSMYDKLFELVILVEDKGKPSLSATEELYIFINGSVPAAAPFAGGSESDSSLALVIICILVFIIVVIITILFTLFMIRRRRMNHLRHQQRQQKYSNYRIQASSSSTTNGVANKTVIQLNSSSNSSHTDCNSNGDLNSKKPGFGSMNGKTEVSFTAKENSAIQSPTSYNSIYLEKLPAHSSVVKYNNQVRDENQTGSSNSYNHLGEVQLQVHDLLHNLAPAADRDLDEASVTDSGKGSSESDIVNRSSPMDDLKGYGHNLSFPSLDPAGSYVYNVHQQQPTNHPHIVGGPLARSSIRSNGAPFYHSNNPSHSKKITSDEHINSKCSPVLKGCMQNPKKALDNSMDGSKGGNSQKKKTVHFVKPYCSNYDYEQSQSEPDSNCYNQHSGYNPSNTGVNSSNSSHYSDYSNRPHTNHRANSTSSNNSNPSFNSGYSSNRTLQFVPGNSSPLPSSSNINHAGVHHQPIRNQYLVPHNRDSMASDFDGESQYSDGDTTTSGSYCMDDDDYNGIIGPDVLV